MPEDELESALMWTNASLPAKYKPWSISFLLALQVAITGGITLGAGISLWWLAIHLGLLYIAFQLLLYHRLLR